MARTFWSGSISFGLVNIPIKLATAVREKNISFHMLSPDGSCRLRRKLFCPETGKEYDFNETAKGYEIGPGQYVLVDEDELDKLRPEAGKRVEILQFSPAHEIDPIYFSSTYYLVPDESGTKAYRLLLEAMKKSERVAVARFVMRAKEHLATIRVRDDSLVLQTMHYADEVLNAQDAGAATEKVQLPAKEISVAEQLIEALTDKFDPTAFRDEYRERVEKLIETKAEGQEVVTAATETEEEAPRVINIIDALQKSLQQARKSERMKVGEPRKHRRKSA
jgi:DNA end-binding protein Ku